ncbi:MAG TPA: proprotein convertase P-domain-containing protein, partial [Sedimentisphaerales bacterium]|nr:proprotein convertase P-domain-containing protein [Sedimentisphaerales bacterium]
MDTRSSAIRMVAALFLVMVFPSVGFSGPVYIYSGDFNLPIPAELNSTKGWMTDAIIKVRDYHIIHDIDVGINLTHTNVFDLQIFLQSPAGTRICLNM